MEETTVASLDSCGGAPSHADKCLNQRFYPLIRKPVFHSFRLFARVVPGFGAFRVDPGGELPSVVADFVRAEHARWAMVMRSSLDSIASGARLDKIPADVVIIWGDDQYENFREDVIPPFAICAYGDIELRPWAHAATSSIMKGKGSPYRVALLASSSWSHAFLGDSTLRLRPDTARDRSLYARWSRMTTTHWRSTRHDKPGGHFWPKRGGRNRA